MATHRPSPQPMPLQPHHGPPPGAPVQPGPPITYTPHPAMQSLTEDTWIAMGGLAELLGDPDDAFASYEAALRINPGSIRAMNNMSLILRSKEDYRRAADLLQAILKIDPKNGEVWGSLGHCYLMLEDLTQAYSAYQSALTSLRDPKEPKLWYGIGILYDRYGSLEHAEEAFSSVMRMNPNFEKGNEIYFRLGIIYKQQSKYTQSLDCFKYIINTPPHPLTEEDIWFQIGHVYEQQKDYENAKSAYQRVLERDPRHAKVLQQLGWLHHQQTSFQSQELAIEYLEQSVNFDPNDAQSWYLLGRCYMSQHKYPKAYESYQQAVYREGRNPTFWCSIGVLYYQINQYRDALDAYSRAIRLNPFISEVWYDLGTLYESCNNQISDAMDAYQRASDLDPSNPHIKARLNLLRSGQGNQPGSAPVPTDVQSNGYGAVGPPGPQWNGPGAATNGHHAPPPPPPAPGPPPGPAGNWARNADFNQAPQPPNPYHAGPILPARPMSPGPEQHLLRPYPEPNGNPHPGPPRRGPTPPQTNGRYTGPPPPPGPQPAGPPSQAGHPASLAPPPPPPGAAHPQQMMAGGRPGLPSGVPPPPGMPQLRPQGPHGMMPGPPAPPPEPEARQLNPNWAPIPGSTDHIRSAGMPPGHLGSMHPLAAGNPPVVMYRTASPRDARLSMLENGMPSPKSAYPQLPPNYAHQPSSAHGPAPGGLDGSAPAMHPPLLALATADPALGERPQSGPKRVRDWDDEPAAKKQASEENRSRLEDVHHRRPSVSPTQQRGEPSSYRRNSMEHMHRYDEQRRAEEHLAAAAAAAAAEHYGHPVDQPHHLPPHAMPPQHLPPMQSQPPQMQPQQMQPQPPPPPPPPTQQPPNPVHTSSRPSPMPGSYRPGPVSAEVQAHGPPHGLPDDRRMEQPPHTPVGSLPPHTPIGSLPPSTPVGHMPHVAAPPPPPPLPPTVLTQPQQQLHQQPQQGHQAAQQLERASRNIDVDENYDDSGDEKPPMTGRNSVGGGGPPAALPAGPGVEAQPTTTPSNASVSSMLAGPMPREST